MRRLRRLAVALLTVALILTSMPAVFADNSSTISNADKAAALKDLGLYAGQDSNDPKVGLENALTTQDSLIFLAKLFGYNDAANALSADQVAEALAKFDDAASISEYAKNVVAYSAANGILSGSTQDGKFFVGAKDTVTAARFATFMLKQMGYTVADYKVSVEKLAETKGSKVDATLAGDLYRDDAVGVMYGALTAEKASGKTVIADIVDDNADLKAKAEKLGLLEVAPVVTEDLAVESVKALNCKQIEIKFNQEMDIDSAESEESYEILDNGENKVELGDNSASLDSDKKTVIITLNKNVADRLTNPSKVKVKVKQDIKAANEKNLGEDAEYEVEVQDGIIPTVTSVKATGNKNIRITFSEPIYDKGNDNSIDTTNFAVKSGTYTYYVSNATLEDNNVIDLTVGTKLIEGPVTVTVNDAGMDNPNCIMDYADYKVFKQEITFDYVNDTSVAVITVKSATKNKVVLHFSKPVKGSDITLYHSVKEVASNGALVKGVANASDITFEFKESKLPSGNVNLYLVNSTDDKKKLSDYYDIKIPDQIITCTVVIDETGPTYVSNKVYSNEYIKIQFNEELDEEVAKDTKNYEIKKYKDNTVISFSTELDPSGKIVKLIVDPKLEDNTEYQVTIKKAQDISGNKSENVAVFTFTTGDNKPPEVIKDPKIYPHCSAIPQDGKIFIVFSEPMNESQMLDKANYMVLIDEGKNYVELSGDDKITKVSDRIVEIYIKELDNKNDPTIRPSVKIAPIMDLANKRLNGSVDAVTVDSIGSDHIITVRSVESNVVVLNFSKPVKGSNIKLYYSQKGNESYKAEVSKADYSDEITFRFNRSLPVGKLKLFLVNSETEDEKLVDRDGIYVPDQSLTCEVEEIPTPTRKASTNTKTPTDTDAPVVKQIILNENKGITIKFNERLDAATATNPDNYVVKTPSDIQSEKISLSASIDSSGRTVELKFDTLLEGLTEYQLVIKEYKDVYGNKNKSEYIYPFTTLECIYPEVVMDPENGQYCFTVPEEGFIYIIYSEAMNEDQMLDKENYQVSIDEGNNFIALGDDDAITKVNEWTVQIYFKEFKGTNIAPYVKIAPITDLAGNKLYDSDEHYIVEGIEPEYVCISGAYLIASNKILITFNKEMKSVEVSDIVIKLTTQDSVYAIGCESNAINSLGQTEVVLILNKGLPTDAEDDAGEPIYIYTADNTSSVSKWGSKLAPGNYYGILNDWTPPEIAMWDHSNDESTPEIALRGSGSNHPLIFTAYSYNLNVKK
ncbi:Ig-like domain-containing protein [Acetivibrio mesophilus]|uniref:SLH domain-containing protein n=1 Tax=Acetivibrio mesophilus TaxID=2487273 RepID=A0A4Q0I842_9FIRM|nr:Ig-like domain-containing protein [Acetivibrio mesophilus]RXE60606.1 hypothetical protein EFD62_01350 [Acetivibrio mesophilus]